MASSSEVNLDVPNECPDTNFTRVEQIRLDHLMSNCRSYPLTLQEFRKFLEKQQAEENLDFLVAVRSYRKASKRAFALEIYEKHVKPGSPQEINIVYHERDRIVKTIEESTGDIPSTVFDNAEKEIIKLVDQLDFVGQFVRSVQTNLSDAERKRRVTQIIFFWALTIALGLFLWLDMKVSRWYRILMLVPGFPAGAQTLSVSTRVCGRLAAQNLRLIGDEKWWKASLSMTGQKIEDPLVKIAIHSKASRFFIYIVALDVIVTAIFVALPSV